MRAAWRVLKGQRDLRLVLSAGLVSSCGDWILLIGLLYRVYTMTGSTVASALTMLSAGVPQVLLGPVAGVFADRWDRKRTMITADVLLAVGLLPLLAVHGPAQVWLVFLVLIWEGAIAQFFSPAQQAMVPQLVPDDQLLVANALGGQVGDIARLVGSALGGVLAALGGINTVTAVDSVSFLASAVLLASIRTGDRRTARQAPNMPRLTGVITDLRDGLRIISARRTLRILMAFGIATSVGEGIFATLITPFVQHVLHGSSQQFGLIAAAQGIGGIAGGVFAAAVSQRIPASRLLGYGALAFGVVDLAIFLYPLGYLAIWPAIVGMIITGLPGALTVAGMLTLLQRNTPDAYRGRLFGTLGAAQGTAVLVGTLAAGYLSRPLGIIPVVAVPGAIWAAAGLAITIWLRMDTDTVAEEPSLGPLPAEIAEI